MRTVGAIMAAACCPIMYSIGSDLMQHIAMLERAEPGPNDRVWALLYEDDIARRRRRQSVHIPKFR